MSVNGRTACYFSWQQRYCLAMSLAAIGSFSADLVCKPVDQGSDARAAGSLRGTLTDPFLHGRDVAHGFGTLALSHHAFRDSVVGRIREHEIRIALRHDFEARERLVVLLFCVG